MNVTKWIIIFILLSTGCSGAPLYSGYGKDDAPVLLTILHTNDQHGRFWKNADGEYGLPARKTLVDTVRSEVADNGGSVLLLDAGDVNTGVPESTLLDAQPDIIGMNALGYDAMTVGNHEFDKPMSVLRKQERWMHFPLLSANIYDARGHRVFTPYRIFHCGRVRIAVIGLTTEESARIANPLHVAGLTFRSAIAEAQDLVPQMRHQADVVVVLSHLGSAAMGGIPPSVALARAVPGIDVIVDGHSHTALFEPLHENGTLIVQAGEYGKYLGRLDLEVRKGIVKMNGYKLLPVNLIDRVGRGGDTVKVFRGGEVPQNPALSALLEPYLGRAGKELNKKIGACTGKFTADRNIIRSAQTDLGVLACKALLERTGAQLAVVNSGGLRTSLAAGDISYRNILEVMPFGNTICTVSMKGAELRTYLETLATIAPGSGGFPQFAGIVIRVEKGNVVQLLVDGSPLDPARTYLLALASYLAQGGDGYPKLTEHEGFVDLGFVDAEVFASYVSAHSPLDPLAYAPQGEILRQ